MTRSTAGLIRPDCESMVTMDIRQHFVLRGPNIWSRNPVIEAWVDLGPLRDSPSNVLPGFNDRLMNWLPGLIEHRCSEGYRGGFHQRLRWGTYLAHILEHTTLELQTLAGSEVGYGRARETSEPGVYKVVFRYQEETLGLEALYAARRLLLAAVYDQPFDLAAELYRLRDLGERFLLGPSTKAIVDAAVNRGIPARRLNSGCLVQLGYGAKQRRIWTAETDVTSAIAESIAQDKELTKSMLRAAGVPVPEGRVVTSPDDAWAAAQEIGTPVVVKPRDANHARGVFLELSSQQQIMTAYADALDEGTGVIVETFAPGLEHRLLVVGDELVAAVRGEAAFVVGDGRSTVAELINAQINSDPRRGDEEIAELMPVLLDNVTASVLERQGHKFDDVIPAGKRITVRQHDSLEEDVTDIVHPSIIEHAVLATKIIGLDVSGIDMVVEDISRPLEEQRGVIVEVNAGPGLLMHLRPRIGKPRPVGEAIVRHLFPEGESGRIPIVSVTGTNGKTTTSRIIARILRETGRHVGLASSDGVTIDGRLIDVGDCAGPRSAKKVLMNPVVDAAVFESARRGILREGLGFDKCDVAVVTNIAGGDHLGQWDLHTPEDMYKVKRSPVDVVLPTGAAVLNAADPLVVKMAELSAGRVLLFSVDPNQPDFVAHCAAGKTGVTVHDHVVVLRNGSHETRLMALTEIPCTHGGRVPFQIENVLAAAAAAWSLDVPVETIRAGLHVFQGNLADDPARFNVFEIAGKTLILVDCRNASALSAVIEALPKFPHRARAVVYSGEQDRRDIDLIDQGRLLGANFERITLCEIEDDTLRPPGEVLRCLRTGVQQAESAAVVTEIPEWTAAVDAAWKSLGVGELLVVQSTTIPKTVRKMQAIVGLEPAEAPRLVSA